MNHTVALSTIGESNYHFGVTYVGTKQLSPTEVRFLSFHSLCHSSNEYVAERQKALSGRSQSRGGCCEGTVSLQGALEWGSFILNSCSLPNLVLPEALNAKLGIWTFSRGH